MIGKRFSTSRASDATPWRVMLAWLVISTVLMTGCAKKAPLPGVSSAEQTWTLFKTNHLKPGIEPGFLVSASLSYSSGKKSARIILDFWGDFHDGLRMDAWSNVGGSLCFMREEPDGLLAFYPDRDLAYTHRDPVIGAYRLGLPFPFSLRDLAGLLSGRMATIVTEEPSLMRTLENGNLELAFDSGKVTRLIIDGFGRTVRMEGPTVTGQTWSIDFSKYEDTPNPSTALAEKYIMLLPDGQKGILRIQVREIKHQPWPEEAMKLELPEDARLMELDGVQLEWTTGMTRQGDQPDQ